MHQPGYPTLLRDRIISSLSIADPSSIGISSQRGFPSRARGDRVALTSTGVAVRRHDEGNVEGP